MILFGPRSFRWRSHSSKHRRITPALLLPAFALLLSGCGGPRMRYPHEHSLSPGKAFHAGLRIALVIPLNDLNDEPASGLDVASGRLMDSLVRLLESKGIDVERVDAAKVGIAAWFRRISTTSTYSHRVRSMTQSGMRARTLRQS